MAEVQRNKPVRLNLDSGYKSLGQDEYAYALNFQPPMNIGGNTKRRRLGKGTQFVSNRPLCAIQMPSGENYSIETFQDKKTGESYCFHYNSNGVNFITRVSQKNGCQIVYDGECLKFSAEPENCIKQFRCYLREERTCKNRGGKYLIFVDGINEYFIDVEASIATNSFSTPFFSYCTTDPCDFVRLCVPDPRPCPTFSIIPLTEQTKSLPNDLLDKTMQFRYQHVYYDGRESIWSKISSPFYQDSLDLISVRGRQVKVRVPVGGPLVEKVRIAVAFDNSTDWKLVATVDKYEQYNSGQQMWYDRQPAPLEGFSASDCSFDYVFSNNTSFEAVDVAETNRNFNPHPRGAQCLMPVNNALGYVNYWKGNCPLPKYEADKFKINFDRSRINKKRGLKSKGFYKFGFVIHGDCGRFSFVNGVREITMPSIQGKLGFDFYEFFYDFTGINLPLWATSVSIVRTENLSDFRLQWKVDSKVVNNDLTYLRIQSLNDYNTAANFGTNTKYQQIKGDRVEFIQNGNNNFFQDGLNYEIVSGYWDKTVSNPADATKEFFNTIVIKAGGELNSVQPGALIEITRKKDLTDKLRYHEICLSLPVVNGKLVNETGYFHTYDTFVFERRIDSGWKKKVEHHSINDYWATKTSDKGRVWVVNEYEDEKRYGRNITICSATIPNRFGDTEKTFDAPEHGDITSVHVKDSKIGIAIGERDNFVFQINENNLRLNAQGNVVAAPADALISDVQPKPFGTYGCQYDSIGSVTIGDGWVSWIDADRAAHVVHDYNAASDIGIGRAESYWREVCRHLRTVNYSAVSPLDKYRFVFGWNSFDNVLMCSSKSLRQPCINNDLKPLQNHNRTLLYSLKASERGEYIGFASYVPDAYMNVDISVPDQCAFVSYQNSQPFIHPLDGTECNNFFGVQCDAVITLALNMFDEKEKIPISVEEQDAKLPWYVHEITTDNGTMVSEIPASAFKKVMDKHTANFLNNRNTPGGLFGIGGFTERMVGYWFLVTFVRDNTDGLKYGTLDNAKRRTFTELDNITFKFLISEPSGFTNV